MQSALRHVRAARDKGVLKGSFAAEESKKVLGLDVYKRLVDEIKHKRPTIYIWGGEPFLYPELFPLVNYMKDAGMAVSVNTNGDLLAKNAEEIVRGNGTPSSSRSTALRRRTIGSAAKDRTRG